MLDFGVPLLDIRVRRTRYRSVEALSLEITQQRNVVALRLDQAIGEGITQGVEGTRPLPFTDVTMVVVAAFTGD